jgi:hypothetical protein
MRLGDKVSQYLELEIDYSNPEIYSNFLQHVTFLMHTVLPVVYSPCSIP